MHRMFWKILSITLLMSAVACGQSLGDIARENREKRNAPTSPPRRSRK